MGLPRRNNSSGRYSENWYFRASRVEQASRRPSPTCTSFRRAGPPGRTQTRFRRVQAHLPSPFRGTPDPPREFYFRRQHVHAPSDIAGSGGAPRLAAAWETEARSVPDLLAGIVNTEGPRP